MPPKIGKAALVKAEAEGTTEELLTSLSAHDVATVLGISDRTARRLLAGGDLFTTRHGKAKSEGRWSTAARVVSVADMVAYCQHRGINPMWHLMPLPWQRRTGLGDSLDGLPTDALEEGLVVQPYEMTTESEEVQQ